MLERFANPGSTCENADCFCFKHEDLCNFDLFY